MRTLALVFIIAFLLNCCSVYGFHSYLGIASVTVVTYYLWLIISSRHFEEIDITERDWSFLALFIIGFSVIKQVDNVLLGCIAYLIYDLIIIFFCYRKHIRDYMNFYNAYSAKSAHPFRKNGAPFRLKLSSAQLVN